MAFWTTFWTVFFFVSLGLFAALVIVTAIGGFFNVRSLFNGLRQTAETPPPEPDEPRQQAPGFIP